MVIPSDGKARSSRSYPVPQSLHDHRYYRLSDLVDFFEVSFDVQIVLEEMLQRGAGGKCCYAIGKALWVQFAVFKRVYALAHNHVALQKRGGQQ